VAGKALGNRLKNQWAQPRGGSTLKRCGYPTREPLRSNPVCPQSGILLPYPALIIRD